MPRPKREKGRLILASDAEAEEVDYVVCIRLADWDRPFGDNLMGACCSCSSAVLVHPTSPKRPPRICMNCATAMESAN